MVDISNYYSYGLYEPTNICLWGHMSRRWPMGMGRSPFSETPLWRAPLVMTVTVRGLEHGRHGP